MDASALLALAHGEPGAETVRDRLQAAIASAMGWSEVVQQGLARGTGIDGLREEFTELGLRIHGFGAGEAERAAALWMDTRSLGLSLADRACLSLAKNLGLSVLTADRLWATLSIGVAVELIR